MLRLRPYQVDQVQGVKDMLAAGINRPAVVAATGLGKTTDFTHLLTDHLTANPRQRGVVWVHRDELAGQARDRIHQHAPHLRPGIVMGNQRDHDRPVVVASIQTVSRSRTRNGIKSWPRRDQLHSVGIQIADECHHAAAPTWRETLEHFGAWRGVPTIGFTATMHREDRRGLGEIWQDIVRRPDGGVWDTAWGIRNGWLCDVRGIRVRVPQLDLSRVHIRGGDLAQEETAEAMLNADTGAAIVRAIQDILTPQYGQRRGAVYAPNTETAVDFAAEMNGAGIRTGVILGTTPKDERRKIYDAFRTGELEWISSFGVLTEGWDAPWCDAIIMARPTKNPALYQQIIGRGLRTFAGKQECIVLDVCGVTEVHGLASLDALTEDRKIKPREGQSLLEAMDEFDLMDPGFVSWDEEFQRIQPVHKVVGTEIDLFGNSHSVWLQTKRGTWFIPAGDQLFFLWSNDDGLFNLGRTSKTGAPGSVLLREDPAQLDIGMALLEQYALDYDPATAGKDAPWRQNGPATAGQKRDMELWRLPVKRKVTKAQAYDAINVAMASYRLDLV